MLSTQAPYQIHPFDLMVVYLVKGLNEGKKSFSPGEVSANFPKLHKSQLFDLISFFYSLHPFPEPYCHVSENVDMIFNHMRTTDRARSYDDKIFTITESGKEYLEAGLKSFCSNDPNAARQLCFSLGININDLLPFAPCEAKVKACDPVQGEQIISHGVCDFVVKTPVNKVTNQGIEVFLKGPFIGGDKSKKFDGHVGSLIPGSDWSGAIWHQTETIWPDEARLIGEYEKCGHIYLINPVSAGLRTNEIVQKHPLDYLFKAIVNYYEDLLEYSPDT